MPATKYTYSIANDFPAAKVATDRLDQEIRGSAIITALDYLATSNDDCDIWFKDALSSGDATALDGLVALHAGTPLPGQPYDTLGNPIVSLATQQADGTSLIALRSRFGKEVIYCSHNLCDPTTWYSESLRVTSKALADNAGIWESGDPYWVDLSHGKIFDEEGIVEDQMIFAPGDPHGYGVSVTVDNVAKTARVPFSTGGGDYTVNYAAGTVTPVSEDWTGLEVRASYSKKSGPGWVLKPVDTRGLIIEKAEVQFSRQISFTSTFRVEVYGYADIFAPQLVQPNGPLPPGTQIPIEVSRYKTVDQLIDEAIEAYPEIPALSSSTGRGYSEPRHIFQFHYASARVLWSSLGMYMRVSIEGGEPYGGERATSTFYCLSKTDPGVDAALVILLGE